MSEKKKTGNRRIQVAFAIAVLIGAIILLVVTERAARTPEPGPPPDAPQTGSLATPPSSSAASPSGEVATMPAAAAVDAAPGPTPQRAFFASPAAPPPPGERSALADGLHAASGDGREDLARVASLFTAFADHFHELPVGNNAEITAALAGDNPRGLAVIPADHPAINPRGELVDRWGTPYFFHQLGAGAMQVRSAGPDLRMHSADDIVMPGTEEDGGEAAP